MIKNLFIFFSGVLLQSCNVQVLKSTSPTYGEVFFEDAVDFYSWMSPDYCNASSDVWSQNWEFLGADSILGIHRLLPIFSRGQKIALPHRISLPNHSLWYRFRGDWEGGFLHIHGDDGVQLWQNGQQIQQYLPGNLFMITGQTNGELIVRVVNNAMSGGLKTVEWVGEAEFDSNQKSRQSKRDLIVDRRKLGLILDPVIRTKLQQSPLKFSKNYLQKHPILMVAPAMMVDPIGNYFLRWVSDQPGSMLVKFEDKASVRLKSADGVFTMKIRARQKLNFSLFQKNSNLGTFSFLPSRTNGNPKMAIWADSQGGWTKFEKLIKLIDNQGPGLSVGIGDLVSDGSDEISYLRLLENISGLHFPHLLIPGNHDYDGFYDSLNPYFFKKYVAGKNHQTYGMQFFGALGLIALDPNQNFPVEIADKSPQADFFHKTMLSEAWKATPWKIILVHQPPFSQGWPGYNGEKSIQKILEPYFHAGLIDLVISGHTHDYERLTTGFSGNEVTFLIVGGAGGGLEPEGEQSEFPEMDMVIKKHHFGMITADATELELMLFGLDGQKLDSLILHK